MYYSFIFRYVTHILFRYKRISSSKDLSSKSKEELTAIFGMSPTRNSNISSNEIPETEMEKKKSRKEDSEEDSKKVKKEKKKRKLSEEEDD